MTDTRQPDQPSTFRLRRRTPGSFLLVPCASQGRSIRCQGQLEAAAATVLVSCPAVANLQEQPFSIWYRWHQQSDDIEIELLKDHQGLRPRNEKTRGCSYVVPDFLVQMQGAAVRLLEIKPSRRVARPEVARKLTAMRLYAEQQRWTFHLLTERQLTSGPLLGNLRLIGRYRHAQVDEGLLATLQQRVAGQGTPFGQVIHNVDGCAPARVRMHVFHLLARGRLTIDPTQRDIDDQNLLYPQGVIAWDPFASVWAPSGCSTGGPGGSSAS